MHGEAILRDLGALAQAGGDHPPADYALQSAEHEDQPQPASFNSARQAAHATGRYRNGSRNTAPSGAAEQPVTPFPPEDGLELGQGSCRLVDLLILRDRLDRPPEGVGPGLHVSGGSAPVTGLPTQRSTSRTRIERVAPPTSTIAAIMIATIASQPRTWRSCAVVLMSCSAVTVTCPALTAPRRPYSRWHSLRKTRGNRLSSMHVRTRKLIGTIVLLLLATVWSLAAMAIAQLPVIASSGWLQAAYYVVVGLAWVLPAMPLIKWMTGPRRRRNSALCRLPDREARKQRAPRATTCVGVPNPIRGSASISTSPGLTIPGSVVTALAKPSSAASVSSRRPNVSRVPWG